MIIEDEPIIRKGLVYSINWERIDCIVVGEADNGLDGMRLIKELKPDILLVDIEIPLIDGLQMIKEIPELKNASIIIISGFSRFDYAQQAIKLGVIRYLSKPIDKSALFEAINQAIQKQKTLRSFNQHTQQVKQELSSLQIDLLLEVKDNKIVNEMLDYIHQNYGQRIVMRDLEKTLNYSETYLNNQFKKATKMTFNRYLTQYRISKATTILKTNPKLTIDEVASQCGFSDYKYFNQVFKKETGYSPKEFITLILNIDQIENLDE